VEFVGPPIPEHLIYRWTGTEPPDSGDVEELRADPECLGVGYWELLSPVVPITSESPVAGDEFYFVVFEKIGGDWVGSPLEAVTVPEFGEGEVTIGTTTLETGPGSGLYKVQVSWTWFDVEPATLIPGTFVVQYRQDGGEKWTDAVPNGPLMFDVLPTGGDTDATGYEIRLLYKTADGWFAVEK